MVLRMTSKYHNYSLGHTIGAAFAGICVSSATFGAFASPRDLKIVPTSDRRFSIIEADDDVLQQSVSMLYDNYSDSTSFGRTFLPNTLRVGGYEIGDDVVAGGYLGGVVDSAGFSFANLSSVNTATGIDVTLRWYDFEDSVLLGEFRVDADFGSPPLPGSKWRLRFGEGFLRNLQIPVRARMFQTVQYNDIRGIDLSDVGVLTGGPTTVGSSSRFARNFTTNEQIDLGSADENIGFFTREYFIPTPSAISVLGLGLVFAVRRRR